MAAGRYSYRAFDLYGRRRPIRMESPEGVVLKIYRDKVYLYNRHEGDLSRPILVVDEGRFKALDVVGEAFRGPADGVYVMACVLPFGNRPLFGCGVAHHHMPAACLDYLEEQLARRFSTRIKFDRDEPLADKPGWIGLIDDQRRPVAALPGS